MSVLSSFRFSKLGVLPALILVAALMLFVPGVANAVEVPVSGSQALLTQEGDIAFDEQHPVCVCQDVDVVTSWGGCCYWAYQRWTTWIVYTDCHDGTECKRVLHSTGCSLSGACLGLSVDSDATGSAGLPESAIAAVCPPPGEVMLI